MHTDGMQTPPYKHKGALDVLEWSALKSGSTYVCGMHYLVCIHEVTFSALVGV